MHHLVDSLVVQHFRGSLQPSRLRGALRLSAGKMSTPYMTLHQNSNNCVGGTPYNTFMPAAACIPNGIGGASRLDCDATPPYMEYFNDAACSTSALRTDSTGVCGVHIYSATCPITSGTCYSFSDTNPTMFVSFTCPGGGPVSSAPPSSPPIPYSAALDVYQGAGCSGSPLGPTYVTGDPAVCAPVYGSFAFRVNCNAPTPNLDLFAYGTNCTGPGTVSTTGVGANQVFGGSLTEGGCIEFTAGGPMSLRFDCEATTPPSPPAPPVPPPAPSPPPPPPEIGGRIYMYPVSSVCSGTPIIRSFAPSQCIDSPGSTPTNPSYMTVPCYSEADTSITIHLYDDIDCTIYSQFTNGQYPVTPGSCFNPDAQSPNGYMVQCGQYSPPPSPPSQPPPLPPPLPNPPSPSLPPPPSPVAPETLEVAADATALSGDSSEGDFPIWVAVIIPVVVIAIVLVLCLYRKRAQAQTSASLLALSSGGLLSRPPTCSWKLTEGSAYLAFLSHYKVEAGSDARYLHDLLQRMVPVRRSGFESSP